MTDTERWALNREIAEWLGWPFVVINGHKRQCLDVPDFAGDMNVAIDMGEQLREMGLDEAWSDKIFDLSYNADHGLSAVQYLQCPALVRAQAAAEVLRERGWLRLLEGVRGGK